MLEEEKLEAEDVAKDKTEELSETIGTYIKTTLTSLMHYYLFCSWYRYYFARFQVLILIFHRANHFIGIFYT